MKKLREQIDLIDSELLKILEKRFEIITQIKALKEKNELCVNDPNREEKIIKKLMEKSNLPVALIEDMMKTIFHHSKKMQSIQQ